MEAEMYEVVLMLDSNSKDAHNPSFLFGATHQALQQVETFINQGYEVSIKIVKGD